MFFFTGHPVLTWLVPAPILAVGCTKKSYVLEDYQLKDFPFITTITPTCRKLDKYHQQDNCEPGHVANTELCIKLHISLVSYFMSRTIPIKYKYSKFTEYFCVRYH